MILRKRRKIRDKQSRRLHAKYNRLSDGHQGSIHRSRGYRGGGGGGEDDDDTFELQALNEMDYENPDI